MKILGWDANITGYIYSASLGGFGLGILLSNFHLLSKTLAVFIIILSFVLSLYFWHIKKVKDIVMK